jgi:hypothetical protein
LIVNDLINWRDVLKISRHERLIARRQRRF